MQQSRRVLGVLVAGLVAACGGPGTDGGEMTEADGVTGVAPFVTATVARPPFALASTPTPTATPTPMSTPTPTPTPTPQSAVWRTMEASRVAVTGVGTFRLQMEGTVITSCGDLPLALDAFVVLPDAAHGVFYAYGDAMEFLRVEGNDYVAYPRSGAFQPDHYQESGAVLLDLVTPLLRSSWTDHVDDLQSAGPGFLDGRAAHRAVFQLDMAEFLEAIDRRPLLGTEVWGGAELLMDQETLLPVRLTVNCRDCFRGIGDYGGISVTFTMSYFGEPVAIPSPDAGPTLLAAGVMQDIRSATPISVGDEVEGTLGWGGSNVYTVELEAGERYVIDVALGTLPDSVLTLMDANGRELAWNDDYGYSLASRIVWTTVESGTYQVVVEEYSGYPGSYYLSVAVRDNSLGGTGRVEVGEFARGSLEWGETQVYAVELEAGTPYVFEVWLGSLADSVLTLRDGQGNELAYNDDYGGSLASQIVWRAPQAGVYYVEVGGYAGMGGSYLLSVSAR